MVPLAAMLAAGVGGCFLLALQQGFDLSSVLAAAGKDTSLTGRTFLWSRARDYIGMRPLLGVGYQPGALAEALREARAGTIGQRAPSILLLCFHYDPSTGRYSLAVLKVLRLMGGLTLVLLAALLLTLRRRRPA